MLKFGREEDEMNYPAIEKGCNHAEAFCHMTYECEKCGFREIIWNSRDGVTPFIISCRKCGNVSQHTDWQDDIYDPTYRPAIGDRIFINITREKAEEYAKSRLTRFRVNGIHIPPSEGTDEYNELLKSIIAEIYGQGDSPTSIIVEDNHD